MNKFSAGLFAVGLIFGGSGFVSADSHDGDKDCPDFDSTAEAEEYWNEQGYSAENDPELLDRDGDGLPCENLGGSSSNDGASEETSDEGESTEEESSDKETASEEETMSHEEEGGKLPETSAPYATYALLGMGLSVLGGAALVARRQS